jgi:hypothetical protein
MLHIFYTFLTRSSLLLFLYTAAGCHTDSDNVLPAYNNYKFDPKVIEKLPVYDSLASAILKKVHLFQININENDAYQAFRYMPASTEAEVFKKLPPEAGTDIDQYFTKLGKDFIYGFDVFKDSTIKIYVRSRILEATPIDIEENLSYYPAGSNIRQREYPVKDSILNTHWQYWTRINKKRFF